MLPNKMFARGLGPLSELADRCVVMCTLDAMWF